MIETWFISDTHFGHKNILEYEKDARPFSTIKEMNEVIIERWNHTVNRNDIVFHLGDFAFGRHNISIAERLNGKKKLIMGNHDTYPSADYCRYFTRLYGILFWERCILSHIPVHPRQLGERWLLNVHGHLHSKHVLCSNDICETLHEDPNYFNVSCEQNHLTPINADIIKERLKTL